MRASIDPNHWLVSKDKLGEEAYPLRLSWDDLEQLALDVISRSRASVERLVESGLIRAVHKHGQ